MSSASRSRADHPSNTTDLDVWSSPDRSNGVRRLVLVPVSCLDRRAIMALDYASRIEAAERRALHVAADDHVLEQLADAWMATGMPHPLFVVDDAGGVAPTVGRVVEHELASGFDEAIVVVGRVGVPRARHRLLHGRTSEAIARIVSSIPGAIAAVMTVATV